MKLGTRSHTDFIEQIDRLRAHYEDDQFTKELGNFCAFNPFVAPQFPRLCGDGFVRSHEEPRKEILSSDVYWWHVSLLKAFLEKSATRPCDLPNAELHGEWYICQIEQLNREEVLQLIRDTNFPMPHGQLSDEEILYSKDMITYLVYWFLEAEFESHEKPDDNPPSDYRPYGGEDDYEPFY